MTLCTNMAARRLAKAAWFDPAEFRRTATEYGFVESHCGDRFAETVISYIAECINRGEQPNVIHCEDWLYEQAVPCESEELSKMFVEVTIPAGMGMADLIKDVIELSEERAEQICSEDATAQIRQWNHWMNCEDCLRCSNGERRKPSRKSGPSPRDRRLLAYAEHCTID